MFELVRAQGRGRGGARLISSGAELRSYDLDGVTVQHLRCAGEDNSFLDLNEIVISLFEPPSLGQ